MSEDMRDEVIDTLLSTQTTALHALVLRLLTVHLTPLIDPLVLARRDQMTYDLSLRLTNRFAALPPLPHNEQPES